MFAKLGVSQNILNSYGFSLLKKLNMAILDPDSSLN